MLVLLRAVNGWNQDAIEPEACSNAIWRCFYVNVACLSAVGVAYKEIEQADDRSLIRKVACIRELLLGCFISHEFDGALKVNRAPGDHSLHFCVRNLLHQDRAVVERFEVCYRVFEKCVRRRGKSKRAIRRALSGTNAMVHEVLARKPRCELVVCCWSRHGSLLMHKLRQFGAVIVKRCDQRTWTAHGTPPDGLLRVSRDTSLCRIETLVRRDQCGLCPRVQSQ